MPIVMPTDRSAIQAALATCGRRDLSQARLMWIQDTERLEVVGVSESLARDLAKRDDLVLERGPREMRFDNRGVLEPPISL